jgi:two-component system phosphate regulon sensor histidine kinase PhoR
MHVTTVVCSCQREFLHFAQHKIKYQVLDILRNIGTTGKLATILLLLVLLPAIFYSAYEFTSLTRSETLIAEIYAQQLDVVLFSLNQYAWDVANSWVTTITSTLKNPRGALPDDQHGLVPFLRENAGIQCLFITDSLLVTPELISANPAALHRINPVFLGISLRNVSEVIERLFGLESSGYRKISSVNVADSGGGESLALIFVTTSRTGTRMVVGIMLDAERFIREVLGQKMDEAAGDNFLISVNKKGSGQPVYGSIAPEDLRQTKELWLFPDYVVGIRLRGQTIAEVVRERFYRNLVLIGLLDVILVAGAWFVYRTVKREVELAQLKADFVSNVSHELKTPLSLIRMFGETLQMKRVRSEEKKQEYYDTIVQETERLTRLVSNILNFSRIEAGKKEYHLVDANLNTIVEDVLKSYGSHLAHQGFAVTMKLDQSLPRITADTESLAEGLLNIIDNAVKYSDKVKSIAISTGTASGMAYVEVKDQGIGIDPQDQKKIFEKFYRVSSGLVHNTKGSGLGLSLVKHIMNGHGGIVSVKSEPGKGSTFKLSFPIQSP